ILVDEMLLDFTSRFPGSSLLLVSATQRSRIFDTIRSTAEDALISTPTHWRHPLFDGKRQDLDNPAPTGGEAAGVPVLLQQLRVASCAPGVPREFWEWTVAIIQAVWAEMGMLHARSMLEMMQSYQERLKNGDGLLTSLISS